MKLDRAIGLYATLSAAILCGFVLGVYALTPVADRVTLMTKVATPLASFAALLGTVVIGRITSKQNTALSKIEKQTNGELTQRMHEVVSTQLDARGLPPTRRATDADLATLPDAGPIDGSGDPVPAQRVGY